MSEDGLKMSRALVSVMPLRHYERMTAPWLGSHRERDENELGRSILPSRPPTGRPASTELFILFYSITAQPIERIRRNFFVPDTLWCWQLIVFLSTPIHHELCPETLFQHKITFPVLRQPTPH